VSGLSDGELRMQLRQQALKEAEARKNEIDKINRELDKIRVRFGMPPDVLDSIASLVRDLQKQQHLYRLARLQTMSMIKR